MASRYSAMASSSWPLSLQGVAEVEVGLGVILLESDGLAVLGDGLVQLALVLQGVAEVAVGLGVILLESDGLAVLGDGLVQLALILQGDAEVVVGFGVILLESDGLAVLGDGLVQLALVAAGRCRDSAYTGLSGRRATAIMKCRIASSS